MARSEPPGMAVVMAAHPESGPDKGRMKPPGMPDEPQDGGKASDEEAQAVMADAHCKDCQNWHPDTGECDKVDGNWQAEDACRVYFTPMGDSEPDQDEQGGPPDNDSDDVGGALGGNSA